MKSMISSKNNGIMVIRKEIFSKFQLKNEIYSKLQRA